jgi:hypothetical protein
MITDFNNIPVVLPEVKGNVLAYMIPYKEIPKAYHDARNYMVRGADGANVAAEPRDIHAMLSAWFFSGLAIVKLNLRPHVKSTDAEVMRYVATILQSWEPSHEYKFVYLTYVLHQLCFNVEWERQ